MNRDENGKLIGDVKFNEVSETASLITPVPRGVGPMTINMLMEQTYRACKRSLKISNVTGVGQTAMITANSSTESVIIEDYV